MRRTRSQRSTALFSRLGGVLVLVQGASQARACCIKHRCSPGLSESFLESGTLQGDARRARPPESSPGTICVRACTCNCPASYCATVCTEHRILRLMRGVWTEGAKLRVRESARWLVSSRVYP